MVNGQKIQVGLAHARKTAEVTVESDTYQITVNPGIHRPRLVVTSVPSGISASRK